MWVIESQLAERRKSFRLSLPYQATVEVNDLLSSTLLTANEQLFIQLRLDGLTMEEITQDLGESAYKVRQILREKFVDLAKDYEINL